MKYNYQHILKQEIQKSLSQNKIKDSFKILKNRISIESSKYSDLVLIEGEFQQLIEQELNGIISNEYRELNYNRTRKKILLLVDELTENDLGGINFFEGENKIKDPRDGQNYSFTKIEDKLWLTENLNYFLPDESWYPFYNSKVQTAFGRLYSWESSKKACIPGWRLPNHDDIKKLRKTLGLDKTYEILVGTVKYFGNGTTGVSMDSENNFTYLDHGFYMWAGKDDYRRSANPAISVSHNIKRMSTCGNSAKALVCRCIKDLT